MMTGAEPGGCGGKKLTSKPPPHIISTFDSESRMFRAMELRLPDKPRYGI